LTDNDDAHRERLRVAGLIIADAIASALDRARQEVPGLTGKEMADALETAAKVIRQEGWPPSEASSE
jgi:hypothetical protein